MQERSVRSGRRAMALVAVFGLLPVVLWMAIKWGSGTAVEAPAAASPSAGHWQDGSLSVRVVTDPGTGCQYLAFWSANRAAIAVVPRLHPGMDACQ